MNFIAYYIIGIPLAIVFGFKTSLGVLGIWIGMAIGNFSQVITLTNHHAVLEFNLVCCIVHGICDGTDIH